MIEFKVFNFLNSSNYTEKTLLIWMQNSFVLLLSLSRNLYHDLAIYIFAWEIFYCLRSLALNHDFMNRNGILGTAEPKLYIPSTLNIDLIMWHTQLIVCAENVKSWFKSCVFHFTFQAYNLPHTLNWMSVSLFKFHIWVSEQF